MCVRCLTAVTQLTFRIHDWISTYTYICTYIFKEHVSCATQRAAPSSTKHEQLLNFEGDDGSDSWLQDRAKKMTAEWLACTDAEPRNPYATAFGYAIVHHLVADVYNEVCSIARQYVEDFQIKLDPLVAPSRQVDYIMTVHMEARRLLGDMDLYGFYKQIAIEMILHARAVRERVVREQDAGTGTRMLDRAV